MAPIWILICCLFIHLLVSLLFLFLMKLDIMKISFQVFPLVVLVPVWGVFMALTAEFMTRRTVNGRKPLKIHDFTLDERDYRALSLSQDDDVVSIVPLEEAILINDAKTRRGFMMDIISEDTSTYVSLLQKARFNDDVEVAHYASTAIMEIQRNYELKIQKCRALLNENPQSAELLESLIAAFRNYIESGLIEENVLIIQRERYNDALMQRIEMPDADLKYYYDAVDNQIALGFADNAEKILESAFRIWPNIEEIWVLKIKLCHMKNDGEKLKRTIKQLQDSKIFLSAETKQMIDFWSNDR